MNRRSAVAVAFVLSLVPIGRGLEHAKDIAETLNLGSIGTELKIPESFGEAGQGTSQILAMAVINMSPYSWSCDLAAESNLPVRRLQSAVRNLGSGDVALVFPAADAPGSSPTGLPGPVRLQLTDTSAESTPTRDEEIRALAVTAADGSGGGGFIGEKPEKRIEEQGRTPRSSDRPAPHALSGYRGKGLSFGAGRRYNSPFLSGSAGRCLGPDARSRPCVSSS